MKKKELMKLISENDVVPYHGDNSTEQVHNYTEDRDLISKIDGNSVEWYTSKIPDDHLFFDGVLEIHWGIKLHFAPETFAFEPYIKSAIGSLRVYAYTQSGKADEKTYPFDSTKGYNLIYDKTRLEANDGTFRITHVEIDVDNKTIAFSSY